MSDERVGRGQPPKHSQFKKGQSGNPRGRPRKAPRADIPDQIFDDIRMAAQTSVLVRTPEGMRKMPAGQALMYSLMTGAIQGKPTHVRVTLSLLERAYKFNLENDQELMLLGYKGDLLGKTPEERAKYIEKKARRSRSAFRNRWVDPER